MALPPYWPYKTQFYAQSSPNITQIISCQSCDWTTTLPDKGSQYSSTFLDINFERGHLGKLPKYCGYLFWTGPFLGDLSKLLQKQALEDCSKRFIVIIYTIFYCLHFNTTTYLNRCWMNNYELAQFCQKLQKKMFA